MGCLRLLDELLYDKLHARLGESCTLTLPSCELFGGGDGGSDVLQSCLTYPLIFGFRADAELVAYCLGCSE